MSARDTIFDRGETIKEVRRAAQAWGWWCVHASWGERGGKPPRIDCGGMERRYRSPPQWYPSEPRLPEADENTGMAVQRAYIRLPQVYRGVLRTEFCQRPWIIPYAEHDLDTVLARKAKVSIGAYQVTVIRSLLALYAVMKRLGVWRA